MLLTYSFDSARGCRSYQSSTSLSVSNTGEPPKGIKQTTFTIKLTHLDFYCLRTTQGSRLGRRNETNPLGFRPGFRRIDGNVVGCRDLLACDDVFVIYFSR